MSSNIKFTVSFPAPQTHYAEIKMLLEGFNTQSYIDVVMPVWAPGSYLVREYSKNVERFTASCSLGNTLLVDKINKNTWRIFTEQKDIIIHYAVYGYETSVRTNFIDIDHAFLSPVATFMYVDGFLNHPVTVEIEPFHQWKKISTGLHYDNTKKHYTAPDFDILFDTPFEIGNQDTWTFQVDNTLHECAMVGKADYDKDRLTKDISKIVKEENKLWGSNPNDYYLFVTHHYQQANGGLEHLNSTILATSRFNYSQDLTYKNYLALVAHEYFHLWNVKRLRPKALGPFDYTQENYTKGLWIMEGFTSYYDNLIIRRCGFHDENEYLRTLAVDFNLVYNRPGYLLQSAAQSSFDTWIKHYRPDENSQNTAISYYNKGAMHAMALDLFIIAQTDGQFRLDDVLRAAYQKFYLVENRGFEEQEFQQLAEEVTGVNLEVIFAAAHHAEDIDYNAYFNPVGYIIKDQNIDNNTPSIGVKVANQDNRTIVKNVDRDSGAWVAGLNVEDEIIAVNDYRIDNHGRVMDYCLLQTKVGDTINLLISRDGIIRQLEIPVFRSNKKSIVIERNPDATENERNLGNIWLSLD